ncbi:MAG: Lactoylglutathione lyase [uncultured Chloroflexi bacterium]|uniref:Lactoylglutathione lyase n=1 Tax=uncultured Chloroflexota bacterium TaxID=166587 RepID=A0A6J4IAW7_9CHLR|nr:MAG: Lactoylglutathione lyase [uncultured Chloroflexota bacterium]
MEPRISFVTLGVRDFERARRFYRDGLGWPLSSGSNDEVAFFRTGGAILALWSRELLAADANVSSEGSGFPGFALAHNVPNKEDVDAVLARAAAAGATILKPGSDAVWGGYTGYFADPDGFPWEVAWNPHFPLGPDGAVQLPG